jgi:aryl-alcohol dehydrogenase-like predicted oxidoreductase
MAMLNADKRDMPYRNLGGTGLMVSALSFGTMTLRDHGGDSRGP